MMAIVIFNILFDNSTEKYILKFKIEYFEAMEKKSCFIDNKGMALSTPKIIK